MKGALVWGILSLALFAAGAVLSVPKVAGYLGWPMWLVFLLLLFDLALVSAAPFTLRECVGTVNSSRRESQAKPEGIVLGCAWLLIIGGVLVPALVFVWLLFVILH